MNSKDNIIKAIRKLAGVIDLEADVLRTRAFGKMIDLVVQKQNAFAELEALERSLNTADDVDDLIRELNALKAKTDANTQRLQNMVAGARDARTRIASLIRKESTFGAYGKNGEPIRAGAAVTLESTS